MHLTYNGGGFIVGSLQLILTSFTLTKIINSLLLYGGRIE